MGKSQKRERVNTVQRERERGGREKEGDREGEIQRRRERGGKRGIMGMVEGKKGEEKEKGLIEKKRGGERKYRDCKLRPTTQNPSKFQL